MAQVAAIPASTPPPAQNTAPVPTALVVPSASPVSAPPISVSPSPATSAAPTAPMRVSVPPVFAVPTGHSILCDSVPTAPTTSATPSLTPISVLPITTASTTPPIHTVPLANPPGLLALALIIWHGLTISSTEMTKLKKTTTHQATSGKDQFAKIYEELIGKHIEDPNYDPSSRIHPVPLVAAKKPAPKSKPKPKPKPEAVSMSEPGLKPYPNASKGKGKAVVEAPDTPVCHSGCTFEKTKH